jgi:hypothetical protein
MRKVCGMGPPDGLRIPYYYLVLNDICAFKIISLSVVKYMGVFQQDRF